jgi:hypothetical protein
MLRMMGRIAGENTVLSVASRVPLACSPASGPWYDLCNPSGRADTAVQAPKPKPGCGSRTTCTHPMMRQSGMCPATGVDDAAQGYQGRHLIVSAAISLRAKRSLPGQSPQVRMPLRTDTPKGSQTGPFLSTFRARVDTVGGAGMPGSLGVNPGNRPGSRGKIGPPRGTSAGSMRGAGEPRPGSNTPGRGPVGPPRHLAPGRSTAGSKSRGLGKRSKSGGRGYMSASLRSAPPLPALPPPFPPPPLPFA